MYFDILIDSRTRNTDTHPSPNNYTLSFIINSNTVSKVKIVDPDIPLTRTLINEKCNTFYVTDFMLNEYQLYIPNGNYKEDPQLLCNEIQKSLSRNITHQVIELVFNVNTDKYTFYSNKEFNINWNMSPSLAKILGFNNISRDSLVDYNNGKFIMDSDYIYNFNNTCVHMVIPQFSDNPLCIKTKNKNICAEIPIVNIDYEEINILFLDENNELYNFENHDHVFVLRLTME
jgi:hypothetical protein